jgi:small multidrug resistance family-3 protein
MMRTITSLLIFILAGLCEIGGGYLMWLWLKEDKAWYIGALGGLILAAYGIVATLQTSNFGRVYAAYGGIFIVMAILWGWKVDGFVPDRYDIIGGIVCLIGMGIIMFSPRS